MTLPFIANNTNFTSCTIVCKWFERVKWKRKYFEMGVITRNSNHLLSILNTRYVHCHNVFIIKKSTQVYIKPKLEQNEECSPVQMEGPYLSVMSLIVTEVEMVRQSFNLSWKSGSSQVRNQNEITVEDHVYIAWWH